MNQRSSFGRSKEIRKDKIIRTKRDDDERSRGDESLPRRSYERSLVSPSSRFKENVYSEKPRYSSRDGQGSLVFRRQERGKFTSRFSKGSTPETSPGRISQSDSLRNEGSRISFGATSHYRSSYRDREYMPKRQEHASSFRIFDESKLMSILQRLQRDEDRERQANMVRQLKELFSQQENLKIVISNLEEIIGTFDDLLQLGFYTDYKSDIIASVGELGAVLGNSAKGLIEWEFSLYNMSKTDDVKVTILKALHETLIIDNTNRSLTDLIPYIMSSLQTALENVDSPDLVIVTVDIVCLISSTYPAVFSSHFKDIVDILIGWHIDTSQKSSFMEHVSKALISFESFWIADINFTITLLGQFLEDMESYSEGLPKVKKQIKKPSVNTKELQSSSNGLAALSMSSPAENIDKISGLIRVLTTVLKSITNVVVINESGPLSWNFFTDVLKKVLKCTMLAIDFSLRIELLTSANECICILLNLLQSQSTEALSLLVDFITVLQACPFEFYEIHILSILSVMTNFVKAVGSCLPVKFVSDLFSSASLSRKLKFSSSAKVQQQLLALQHAVLRVKNVHVVEEFYKCMMDDIEDAFSVLTASDEDLKDNESLSEAEISLLSSLSALVEIGNAKHSIIRMWALKPTFFDVVVDKMQLKSLGSKYPVIQYSLLFILYSHCQRHKHFINSSSLINQSSSRASSGGHNSPILTGVLSPPPSSGNLGCILSALVMLLKQDDISYDSRLLVARWAFEIVENVQQYLTRLAHDSSFQELISAIIDTAGTNDDIICKSICSTLKLLLSSCGSALPEAMIQRCYEVCVLKLSVHDEEIQNMFASLLVLLPLNIIISGYPVSALKSYSNQLVSKDGISADKLYFTSSDIWAACHGHMKRQYMENFYSHHFRTVIAFILQGVQPENKKWLLQLFYSCPPPEKRGRVDKLLFQLSGSSSAVLWFWAVWEVAQTCVMNKLRTPLGKPQETFMAIEVAIKTCVKLHSQYEGHSFGNNIEDSLLRVHLLLSLMENLEKLMYNAYEGCAAALSSPPKTVRTFFRTNKATCLEWLGRVRLAVVYVALKAGHPAVAFRHGCELLHDLKNNEKTQEPEFENALCLVIRALVDLRCPEAVLGFYVWCKDKIGQKFTWIKAAIDHAAGRFEMAAHEYSHVLHTLTHPPSPAKAPKNVDEVSKTDKIKNGTSVHLGLYSSRSNIEDIFKIFDHLSIKDTSAKDIDPRLHSFLLNQITECYINLGSWCEVPKWLELQEKIRFSQNGINVRNAFAYDDLSFLSALTEFEDENKDFLTGKTTTHSSDSISDLVQLSVHHAPCDARAHVNYVQKLLLSAAIKFESKPKPTALELKSILENLDKAKVKIMQLMKISAINWPPYIDPLQASLFVSASALSSIFREEEEEEDKANEHSHNILIQDNAKLDPPDYCCSTLTFTLAWQNVYFHMLAKELGHQLPSGSVSDLLLVSARLARKQQNLKLSQKLLMRNSNYLLGNKLEKWTNLYDSETLKKILRNSLELMPSEKLVRLQREGAKLLHCSGDSEGAYEILLQCSSSLTNKLNEEVKADYVNTRSPRSVLNELNSRSLLSLVKYLQQDTKGIDIISEASQDSSYNINNNNSQFFLKTISEIERLKTKKASCSLKDSNLKQENVGDMDFLVGRLLQLSVNQCPSLAKAWCAFASWCYRWGRKAVDAVSSHSLHLLPEERNKIISLLPNMSKEEIDAVFTAITGLHSSSGAEWDSQDIICTENVAEAVQQQLLSNCPFLLKISNCEEVLEHMKDIWRNAVSRTYYYYKMAAQAYLQYLHLNDKTESTERCEDDNVTATLRLLRLVVKHASELREVLEDGLAKTPTAPWRGIIPQLFSRLNHPEPYVRQSISDLLCRVAQASPHLIVFPAVVGSLTLKAGPQLTQATTGLFGSYFSQAVDETGNADVESQKSPALDNGELVSSTSVILSDEDVSEEDQQKTTIMQNCFAALVETLGHQDSRTISEVKNLVHELHRITLLWDELWLGTLNLHHSEISRRMSNLEKEISKVMNNSYLSKDEKREIIKEKHAVHIKPTLFVLEQLQMITNQPAETPHEQWFQKTFQKHIDCVLNKLKNPRDPSHPHESLTVYKQFHQLLQQKVQQQSRSHMLMESISPVLASLKSTVIPMPGINKKVSSIITIQSVSEGVTILPTKTKPKKLSFIGSDGQKYTYLFKGLEDLHLDERIMQFLSIVNNMFMKNKRNKKDVYNARHYSVTPLGPRSGLIEWVDGATALFGLYKRWQQREAMLTTLKGQTSTGNTGTAPILRPSEIYYNKLSPLLKEKGLSNLENRKDWPISVLLDVLKELMKETPNDLLAKELWCSCCSALEWWNVTQTYNHSTAVMSIIGYIIGLGDRHLDNVLVDLQTGEVVHIDYNVCFEKGKNLRVPEKVPFRMTPNIETALGLTGVEGTFRVSCEHILKVLRKGRETLLTLLEAFVYDPLVDWTPGNEGGYTGAVYGGRQVWATEAKQTKQKMEIDIAYSMFAIRVAEIKGEWLQNRDDLLSALPKLENFLEEWKDAQLQLQVAESQLQEACLEKALLEEAQANTNHHLYTLPKRHNEVIAVKKTVKAAKDAIQETLTEYQRWNKLHSVSLNTVCGSELTKWCREASNDSLSDSLSIVSVVDFLQSAGQGQLVQQCEHAETELNNVLQQQRITARNCIELLTTYAAIILQYGPTYKECCRSFKFQMWLENLLNNFTVLRCQEIVNKFHSSYGVESMDMLSVQSAASIQFQLQTAVQETNARYFSLLERQRIDGLDDKNSISALVDETRLAILCFVSENAQQGHLGLFSVVLTALYGLHKRLMMMETAAAAAGDHLVDLTSWNGDWFLDEIHSMCANIAELMKLLQDSIPNQDSELKPVFNGVQLAYCIFSALEDLSLNFQNIILPEAIKSVQEPSVIEIASKLDRIIARCGVPLDRLITELKANIRCVIMETQVNESCVNDIVKKLKNEFESLMKKTEPQISDLNHGQMLLMGFNGLFTKLDSDVESLLFFLNSQAYPPVWRKLDFFRDTIALTPSLHLPTTRTILKDIYFLRKLLAIQQFFHVCHDMSATLQLEKHVKSSQEILLVTDHQLVKPVKLFIADYVRQMVLGLPSQAIGLSLCLLMGHLRFNVTAEIELRDVGVESKISFEEIGKQAVELCVNENFLQSQLPAISTLVGNFDAAWRKEDMCRRLEQRILLCKNSLQRIQLQLASFQWFNEDILNQGNVAPIQNITTPTRATIMSEIRKVVQTLQAFENVAGVSKERYLNLTSSIEQRLKWATGANPSLAAVQDEFEAAINVKTVAVASVYHLSRDLVSTCNGILHFEALRTRTSEAVASDTAFIAVIARCQESCLLAENCNSHISTAEEHLVELDPSIEKDGITTEWISSVMEKVSKSLSSCREKLEQKKSVTFICWESLSSHVGHVHDLISMHHKLMSEVRHILRNLSKHEEQKCEIEQKAISPIHNYITMYKEFSERITSVIGKLLSEGQKIDIVHLDEIKTLIPPLSLAVTDIYNQLLELAGPLGNRKSNSYSSETSKHKRSESLNLVTDKNNVAPAVTLSHPRTPQRGAIQKKSQVTRDPRTGKAIQERNIYATNVWKRVKMKLDGRDPDPSKKSTVAEQVDFVIREATNLENLAVLYEGWTPWV